MHVIQSLLFKLPRWCYAAAFGLLVVSVALLGSNEAAASQVPHPFTNFDKILHFTAFSLATGLLWMSRARPNPKLVWLTIALLGAADEIHQYFLPFRSCDIYDWLTDIAAATFVVFVMNRYLNRTRT